MKYVVFKLMYRENARWYVRPVGEAESIDEHYVFDGDEARLRACRKAKELNEKEGVIALAA